MNSTLDRFRRAVRAFRRRDPWLDMAPWQREIVARVSSYTMASAESALATIMASECLVRHGIEGAFVEYGVWRGGQMMAAMQSLQHLGAQRDFYLFDIFEGMTASGEADVDLTGQSASTVYSVLSRRPPGSLWCEANEEEVRANIAGIDYPMERVGFVKGDVLKTVPETLPDVVALLRLDTDWYELTLHELINLCSRLSRGRVAIVDGYGHWKGAGQAVAEHVRRSGIVACMHRIDYSGRQRVKQ